MEKLSASKINIVSHHSQEDDRSSWNKSPLQVVRNFASGVAINDLPPTKFEGRIRAEDLDNESLRLKQEGNREVIVSHIPKREPFHD